MKRSNRFLLSLAAAVLTFASLYAFTGRPPGFDHRNSYYDREGCGRRHHRTPDEQNKSNKQQAPAYRSPDE